MQSTWVWVLLLIIAVLIIGALTLFMKVSGLNKRFMDLKERYQEIDDLPIEDTLAAVKKMHLIGVSQASLEEWETKYQENLTSLNEVAKDFDELAETIGKYSHIKHSQQFLDYLDDRLADLNADAKDIYEGLHKLRASEQQNSERIESSVELLKTYEKQVAGNEETFGVALPEVNKRLVQVQNTFDKFEKLNKNGDPVEAAQFVQQAEQELEELTELVKTIPTLNHELEVVFVDQLKDLAEGYRRLQEMKFKFRYMQVPISDQIRNLREERQSLVENLKRCDLDVVASGNRRLHQSIEELYTIMQREIDAKTYVENTTDVVTEFIEHANKNNRQLMIELDHASQSYVFHNNELGHVRNFQHEIDNFQTENDSITAQLEQNQAVYTEIEAFYKQVLNVLEDIENEQVTMDQTVIQMGEDLKASEQAFDDFEFKMRTYKRFVEKHRLPGLPKEYLDYFFLVSDHIERLGVELGKVRVDTMLLQEYIEKIGYEVKEVAYRTTELIDHAMLAEQYMQYANRYRISNNLQETMDEAMRLYNSYQYTEAMNLVKVTLSKIEPDAIERIDNFYQSEREVIE